MNFSDWSGLSADERKKVKWHRKPHIKTATLFSIVLLLFAILFIVRIGKNETSHLNKKPSAQQAYSMAQTFVKDKLKLPASADFPKTNYKADIDTASNSYLINGFVNAQDSKGHFVKQQWTAKLKYSGGDWSERKSWVVDSVGIE
jgi:hypothetical protein